MIDLSLLSHPKAYVSSIKAFKNHYEALDDKNNAILLYRVLRDIFNTLAFTLTKENVLIKVNSFPKRE